MRLLRFFIISLCFIAVAGAATQATAQTRYAPDEINREAIIQNQYQNKYMYEYWVSRAKTYGEGKFPFYNIVNAYSLGPDYDPFSKETLDKLYEYAYLAQNAETENEQLQAEDDFKDLLDDHYGNLDVLNAGISLVRQNPILGDLKFLIYMKNGITQRALNSGTGIDAYSAYDLFTSGEEVLILKTKNGRIIDVEEINTGSTFYRIYTLEDKDTGVPSRVYFNFSSIMRGLITAEKLKDPFYKYEARPPRN